MSTNPKTDAVDEQDVPSNTVKNPDDWTTGKETMTGAQASYLKTLSEEAGEPFDETLSKGEASKRRAALPGATGRGNTHSARSPRAASRVGGAEHGQAALEVADQLLRCLQTDVQPERRARQRRCRTGCGAADGAGGGQHEALVATP